MDKLTPEQEADRLYPYLDREEYATDREYISAISNANFQRSAHITAARMYMGEVDRLINENHKLMAENDTLLEELGELREIQQGVKRLKTENLSMRDALQCIVGRIEGVEWEGLDMVNAVQKVKEYATEALKNTTHG